MTSPVLLRPAEPHDRHTVESLLVQADLPVDGLPDPLEPFLVAVHDGAVVGAVGLEVHGDAALLRSCVVATSAQGLGVGEALVRGILDVARRRGLRQLTLLTTTAEGWFPRFGFRTVSRDAVPAALRSTAEFTGACPATATVMQVGLD